MRFSEIALLEGLVKQVEPHFGQPPVSVYVNPSPEQIEHAFKRSKHGTLRGHLDHRLLVWDGSDTTHDHIDDTGELGKLRGIRFLTSILPSGKKNTYVAAYGRESKHPLNPETLDEFGSHEQAKKFFFSNPLVKKAFGEEMLGESSYEAGRDFWNEVKQHYVGSKLDWYPEVKSWPPSPSELKELDKQILQQPQWLAYWAYFDWRNWQMATKWWFDKHRQQFVFYDAPFISYHYDIPHLEHVEPARNRIVIDVQGNYIPDTSQYSKYYVPLPSAMHACMAVVKAAQPKLEWMKGGYFIRFGRWYPHERSKNYLTGEMEPGVSVYVAEYDLDDGRWAIDPSVDEAAISGTMGSFFADPNKRIFLVRGRELKRLGSDGEPLLRDVKLIRELKKDEVYCPGIYDPREEN